MSRVVELPDELYRDLEHVAREHGLTPADWIAATLARRPDAMKRQSLSELLQGLIGTVDSTRERRGGSARTAYSELIARKLEGQGLRRQ
jgi:hypothetical protein